MSRQKFDNTTTSYLMKPHNSKAAIISDMNDSWIMKCYFLKL
jgi:hypothetical protein